MNLSGLIVLCCQGMQLKKMGWEATHMLVPNCHGRAYIYSIRRYSNMTRHIYRPISANGICAIVRAYKHMQCMYMTAVLAMLPCMYFLIFGGEVQRVVTT